MIIKTEKHLKKAPFSAIIICSENKLYFSVISAPLRENKIINKEKLYERKII